MSVLLLVLLGFIVGAFGTLIGAGGGFLLVPILLLVYPERSPELITSISLAVVFLNAASGSVAYALKKRIDYKSAFLFCLTTLPGSIVGAYLTEFISRDVFDVIFSILLILLSAYLIINPEKKNSAAKGMINKYFWPVSRELTDIDNNTFKFRYDLLTALIISFFVGIASSLLGIGGGIIHVPAMVMLLNFPVYLATSTSHFVLGFMGLSGTTFHYLQGNLRDGMHEILYLGIGVIAGAQLGAAVSHTIKGKLIIRSLAIALGLVAIRIIWARFMN